MLGTTSSIRGRSGAGAPAGAITGGRRRRRVQRSRRYDAQPSTPSTSSSTPTTASPIVVPPQASVPRSEQTLTPATTAAASSSPLPEGSATQRKAKRGKKRRKQRRGRKSTSRFAVNAGPTAKTHAKATATLVAARLLHLDAPAGQQHQQHPQSESLQRSMHSVALQTPAADSAIAIVKATLEPSPIAAAHVLPRIGSVLAHTTEAQQQQQQQRKVEHGSSQPGGDGRARLGQQEPLQYSLHFGLPMFMAERRDVSYERAQQIRQQQQADPLLQVYFDGHSDDLSESADLDLNEEAQWDYWGVNTTTGQRAPKVKLELDPLFALQKAIMRNDLKKTNARDDLAMVEGLDPSDHTRSRPTSGAAGMWRMAAASVSGHNSPELGASGPPASSQAARETESRHHDSGNGHHDELVGGRVESVASTGNSSGDDDDDDKTEGAGAPAVPQRGKSVHDLAALTQLNTEALEGVMDEIDDSGWADNQDGLRQLLEVHRQQVSAAAEATAAAEENGGANGGGGGGEGKQEPAAKQQNAHKLTERRHSFHGSRKGVNAKSRRPLRRSMTMGGRGGEVRGWSPRLSEHGKRGTNNSNAKTQPQPTPPRMIVVVASAPSSRAPSPNSSPGGRRARTAADGMHKSRSVQPLAIGGAVGRTAGLTRGRTRSRNRSRSRSRSRSRASSVESAADGMSVVVRASPRRSAASADGEVPQHVEPWGKNDVDVATLSALSPQPRSRIRRGRPGLGARTAPNSATGGARKALLVAHGRAVTSSPAVRSHAGNTSGMHVDGVEGTDDAGGQRSAASTPSARRPQLRVRIGASATAPTSPVHDHGVAARHQRKPETAAPRVIRGQAPAGVRWDHGADKGPLDSATVQELQRHIVFKPPPPAGLGAAAAQVDSGPEFFVQHVHPPSSDDNVGLLHAGGFHVASPRTSFDASSSMHAPSGATSRNGVGVHSSAASPVRHVVHDSPVNHSSPATPSGASPWKNLEASQGSTEAAPRMAAKATAEQGSDVQRPVPRKNTKATSALTVPKGPSMLRREASRQRLVPTVPPPVVRLSVTAQDTTPESTPPTASAAAAGAAPKPPPPKLQRAQSERGVVSHWAPVVEHSGNVVFVPLDRRSRSFRNVFEGEVNRRLAAGEGVASNALEFLNLTITTQPSEPQAPKHQPQTTRASAKRMHLPLARGASTRSLPAPIVTVTVPMVGGVIMDHTHQDQDQQQHRSDNQDVADAVDTRQPQGDGDGGADLHTSLPKLEDVSPTREAGIAASEVASMGSSRRGSLFPDAPFLPQIGSPTGSPHALQHQYSHKALPARGTVSGNSSPRRKQAATTTQPASHRHSSSSLNNNNNDNAGAASGASAEPVSVTQLRQLFALKDGESAPQPTTRSSRHVSPVHRAFASATSSTQATPSVTPRFKPAPGLEALTVAPDFAPAPHGGGGGGGVGGGWVTKEMAATEDEVGFVAVFAKSKPPSRIAEEAEEEQELSRGSKRAATHHGGDRMTHEKQRAKRARRARFEANAKRASLQVHTKHHGNEDDDQGPAHPYHPPGEHAQHQSLPVAQISPSLDGLHDKSLARMAHHVPASLRNVMEAAEAYHQAHPVRRAVTAGSALQLPVAPGAQVAASAPVSPTRVAVGGRAGRLRTKTVAMVVSLAVGRTKARKAVVRATSSQQHHRWRGSRYKPRNYSSRLLRPAPPRAVRQQATAMVPTSSPITAGRRYHVAANPATDGASVASSNGTSIMPLAAQSPRGEAHVLHPVPPAAAPVRLAASADGRRSGRGRGSSSSGSRVVSAGAGSPGLAALCAQGKSDRAVMHLHRVAARDGETKATDDVRSPERVAS